MILSTLVTSQLHFEMCAGLYGHPVYFGSLRFTRYLTTRNCSVFETYRQNEICIDTERKTVNNRATFGLLNACC